MIYINGKLIVPESGVGKLGQFTGNINNTVRQIRNPNMSLVNDPDVTRSSDLMNEIQLVFDEDVDRTSDLMNVMELVYSVT